MKQREILKGALLCALILVVVSANQLSAQRSRRGGPYGDWVVKYDSNGRTRESIVSLSRNQDGNLTGSWISFWGLGELNDITFDEDKLSFTRTRTNRDGGTSTSKFVGTIADGVLSGTVSSEQGSYELKGKRGPRMPWAVGKWETKYTVGEREIVSTLIIKSDDKGNLSAEWPSDMVEHTVTDVILEGRDLTFQRVTKIQDRQWEATFAGTIQRNELTGSFKSERGEMPVTGTRIGSDLIGTWNLDISSERGNRKQRLLVNRDMSGRYGAIPIEEIILDGDSVSFKVTMAFRDQTFSMAFTGKLADATLTGELTSDRGSQKITGTKVVRRRGPRNAG